MSNLKLYLLGPLRLERDDEPLDISLRKALALLAYLAVTRQSHSRDTLATLFWPDDDQSKSRGNLRRALSRINTALGKGQLETDRERAGLNPKANLWLDVDQFQRQLAECQTHGHPSNEVCTDCLPLLTKAVSTYTDDFLTGFTLPDCPDFDEWQFFQNEGLRQALASALERLVQGLTAQGDYESAIPHARRWLALGPLHEPAHRQLMELYAHSGQQAAAVRQYNECVRILDEELGVTPSQETTVSYEAIKTKRISPQPSQAVVKTAQPPSSPVPWPVLPTFLEREAAEVESSPCVARERELTRLEEYLQATLAGRGRVIFITGEAGHGKTTLLHEFARRAQVAQSELIVASGNCNVYAGVGDPYLPFREVMGMLTGDVEARWAAGAITRDHASRLWRLLPDTVKALVKDGHDLIDVFVSGAALVDRTATSVPDGADWLEQLEELTRRKQAETTDLEQGYLFEQYATVLRSLAAQRPLLITLDDLQWADAASISLLFHLGRRLEGSQFLIVGAYRPEEVALGRDGKRHPLQKVLGEFKRTFGDVWLDLVEAAEGTEGQTFVDVLLDNQPNRLGEEFRQALFRHAGGHPLFTIELLRTMQERGDLVQESEGGWVEGPTLNWETLPARVEGVIEERIDRLAPELRELLAVASVEGENFTAEVVARVQQIEKRQLLRHLSQELEKRHRLVRERGVVSVGQQHLSRYRFAHILFQRYLYNDLSEGERRFFHRAIAEALEVLYQENLDEIAMQLARHYVDAGEQTQAVTRLCWAGDRARRLAALDEAARFYREALEHWPASDRAGRAETLRKLGECQWMIGRTQEALETLEACFALFEALDDREGAGTVQRMLGQVYSENAEWEESLRHYQQALAILEQIPESVELARVISAISQMHFRASAYDQAITWGERALTVAARLSAKEVTMHALNNVGFAHVAIGQTERGFGMLQDSLQRALDLGLPFEVGRAQHNTAYLLNWLCQHAAARSLLEDMQTYARQHRVPHWVSASLILLAELDWLTGRWADALAHRQSILEWQNDPQFPVLEKWIAGTSFAWIDNDLGQAEAARQELEKDLPIVRHSGELQRTRPYLGQLARTYAILGLESATTAIEEFLNLYDSTPYVDLASTIPLLFACQWLADRPDGLDEARACVQRLERADKQIGSPETDAALSEGRGSVALAEGDPYLAVEQFRQAVAGWEAIGRPYDRTRALKGLGYALLQVDDADGARAAFNQALGIVELLAAKLEDEELKTSFLNSPLVQEIRAGLEYQAEEQRGKGAEESVKPSPLHNLPLQPTPFIGRETELAALDDLITNPDVRLITIVGPGGMGKTRLSIEAATASLNAFANGVCFVSLAPISSADYLPSAIADALNLKFYGSKPPQEQLLNHLRDQQLLLLLDNFEHVLAGADLLSEILLVAPQVKLLVTSRERLNVQPEWVYELSGLTFPVTGQTAEVSETSAVSKTVAYSALQLFEQRAQQAQATFAPSAEDLLHIVRISQIVDGMPLALELAAAWISLMSCAEIADEIARNFDFLATTLRDMPERHRSLRAVFRHSWSLLTVEEQAIYRQLSVFRGGFTREAVEQVTGSSLQQLADLVGKSLLRRTGSGRYEIHELLRQYAAEKLAESTAEQKAAHAAHAAYFATFLGQRSADLRGSRQLEAVTEVDADLDNVRQCWQWLVDNRDAEKLYQATSPLSEFCQLRGRQREGERAFRLVVETLPAWSEETATKTQRMVMGIWLEQYNWFASNVGSKTHGPDLHQQSVALLRPLQPAARRELALTLGGLGLSQLLTGDASSARQSMEEGLALARAAGDNFLIGVALMNMGQTAEFQGEYRRAESYFQESAKILGAIGEKHYRGYTLNNWGRAAYGMGQYAQAEQLIQEALPIRQEFDDQISISFSLLDLGKLAFMRGAYVEAERQVQASLELAERKGRLDIAARCYNALGWVARARGDLAQAEECHQQSLTIFRNSGERLFLPPTLNGLAQVAIEQQEYEQARQYLDESLALSQELANVGAQAVASGLLGHIAVAEGALAESARYYRQALEIVSRTGAAPVALDSCTGVAQLYLDTSPSRTEQSARLLVLARDHPAATQETRDRVRARLADLPAETIPAASTTVDLWKTISDLIADLTNLEEDSGPASTLITHNLPPQPTPFIGREKELAALDDLIANPEVRLITIVGPGGMGKTRLALASAERQLEIGRFPNGVYFVALAPLSSVDHIIPTTAEALNFPLQGSGRSLRQQILDYLRQKRMLIVLDNFEHLLDGADLIADVLQAAPEVKILATSRERLQLHEEQVYPIRGFEFLDLETVEDAVETPVVKLFMQSAQRIQPDFELEADNLTDLAHICRLVEGLPLGLEMAASWVNILSLADIAAEIQQSLDFLETQMRNIPERHRSMQAVFDTSWQRLSETEQDIFSQLSVFRGSFTRKAAQEVTGASLRLLRTLANKSLLRYNQSRDRYEIHELLRQYGAGQLAEKRPEVFETSAVSDVRNRHSAYYCTALQQRESDLKGARQREALAEIEADIENVRAAWEWATSQRNLEQLAQAMDSLGYFCKWRGRYQEGKVLFRTAAESLESTTASQEVRVLAKILAWQSLFCRVLGDNERIPQLLRQSLSVLESPELSDQDTRLEKSFILRQVGDSAWDVNPETAVAHLERSLALSRALDDRWGVANALESLGWQIDTLGYSDEVQQHLEEALAIRRTLEDRRGTATALERLSLLARYQGQWELAEQWAEECYTVCQEIGDRASRALGSDNLGMTFIHLSRYAEAESLLQESIAIYQELGDRAKLATALWRLGLAQIGFGQYEQARTQFQMLLNLSQEIGDRRGTGRALLFLGRVSLVEKAYAEAQQYIQQSVNVLRETGNRIELVLSLSSLGRTAHHLGQTDQARQYAYEALQLAVQSQLFMAIANALIIIALLFADQGKNERALALDALLRSRYRSYANSREWEVGARRHFADIAASLPPKVAKAARARGRALDLWETAGELLEEVSQLGWSSDE